MTIQSTNSKHVYNGNGVTRLWDYDFPIEKATDIEVYFTGANGDVAKVESNYVVDTVNFQVEYPTVVSGLPLLQAGTKITLLRNVPLEQGLDLRNRGNFNAETLEQSLDKLTMIAQQHQEALARSVKYPVDQSPTDAVMSTFLSTIEAAKVDAQAAATAAGTAKTAAEASQTAAGNSAAAAASSATSAANSANAADSSKTAAQTAQTAAETAKIGAETAKTAAETAQTAAAGSATTATTKAEEAATSATNAASSASTAITKAGAAESSAMAAGDSADAAAVSAASAAASAQDASGRIPIGGIFAWLGGYFSTAANGGFINVLGNTITDVNSYVNPAGYYVCDGSLLNDAASPIFSAPGRYLPNLTDSRFLMGSTSAGASGGSNSSAHTHSLPAHYHSKGTLAASASSVTGWVGGAGDTHQHPMTLGRRAGGIYSGAQGWGADDGAFDAATNYTDAGGGGHAHNFSLTAAAQALNGNVGATASGNNGDTALTSGAASVTENRPQYLSCFYIMRIK